VVVVSSIDGIARGTINRGLTELRDTTAGEGPARCPRHTGGGGTKPTEAVVTLMSRLQGLVEATTRGDPQRPLRRNGSSRRNLAQAVQAIGHRVGHDIIADLLCTLNYRLQNKRKSREGTNTAGRDAQCHCINAQLQRASGHNRNERFLRRLLSQDGRGMGGTSHAAERVAGGSGDRGKPPGAAPYMRLVAARPGAICSGQLTCCRPV
jgi:hypothetical protein